MNAETHFRMAEIPEENARLFSSMTHAELVENCVAAAAIVIGQIERAEHSALRAKVAIRQAASHFNTIENALELLKSSTELRGRTNRMIRDRAVASVIDALSQVVALGGPDELAGMADINTIEREYSTHVVRSSTDCGHLKDVHHGVLPASCHSKRGVRNDAIARHLPEDGLHGH